MIPGALHRSPGICLTAEENSEKPQLGDRLMKCCAISNRLKWGPFPPNEVVRIAQHVSNDSNDHESYPVRHVTNISRKQIFVRTGNRIM